MKKFKLYAIFVMAMAIIVTVAVVSCKKETSNALLGNKNESVQSFNPREIEDMNAYLKDFKQKMQSATKGEDEALSIEDAAWHLACLANFDFCNINVNYDDFLFDTIDMQLKVEDGTMLLSDLGTAYDEMCTKIQQFKKGFNHCDQNLYYINVSIDANGNARIALMTSFTSNTKDLHTWYFSDAFEAADACDEYFSEDSIYYWSGLGANELERVLNLFEHHENGVGMGGVMFFAPTRNHTFDYTNTYDPYNPGYGYINESRVFAKRCTSSNTDYIIQLFEICYCLDSYLGLGYDYLYDYDNEFPVCWTVNCKTKTYSYDTKDIYHQLYVEYGALVTHNPTPND